MKAKIMAGLVTVALVGYFLLMARQAAAFISAGGVLVFLGTAILVLPLIGAYVVMREWQFGLRVSELADHLASRGELPVDDLPKRASGRPVRHEADGRFAERAAQVHDSPHDPGAWFRLAVAYDDAGDRKRARATMRTAVQLHAQHSQGSRREPAV